MHHDNIIIPSYLFLFFFFIMIYVLYFSRMTLGHMVFSSVINKDVYDSDLSLLFKIEQCLLHAVCAKLQIH